MARVTTSNYQADVDTIFQWATVDGDFFDRELDLSFLARALERHDHSANRGLPVTRVATGSIVTASFAAGAVDSAAIGASQVVTSKIADLNVTTAKIADLNITTAKINDLAVTTAKIADLNVTNGKIAAGTITHDKLLNGLTGPITFAATTGAKLNLYSTTHGIGIASGQGVLFGAGLSWGVANDAAGTGFNALWHTGNDGPSSGLNADLLDNNEGTVYLARVNHTGTQAPATISPQGAASGLDADLLDGQHASAFAAVASGVPVGAIVMFRTAAERTAAGASWTAETVLDGRIPVGVGTTFSQTFAEATSYGSNWTPLTGLVIPGTDGTHIFLAASAASNNASGATNLPTPDHNHTVPATTWLPPMRGMVYGRRI